MEDEEGSITRPTTTQRASLLLPGNAILLDARNVYETRVGHFAVPNVDTLFPNTRKFSSLPLALNTDVAASALSGKDVYMYCTGEWLDNWWAKCDTHIIACVYI